MKRSIKVRVVALCTAAAILTGALAVSAVGGTPYEVLKNAVINAFMQENFTMEAEVTLRQNGQVIEHQRNRMVQDGTHQLNETFFSDRATSFNYESDRLRMHNIFVGSDEEQWFSVREVHDHDHRWDNRILTPEVRHSAQFRFAELLIDLAVGDLKNNIHMENIDGYRRITGSVTQSQLPELLRLGIDMMVEQNLRWSGDWQREDFAYSWEAPIQNLTIDRINGTAEVDANGQLRNIFGHATITAENIFGEVNTLEADMRIIFTEIGTSRPRAPIADLYSVFTPGFTERLTGNIFGNVFFTLNDDGSVNQDSITDLWPGSQRWYSARPIGCCEFYNLLDWPYCCDLSWEVYWGFQEWPEEDFVTTTPGALQVEEWF